MSKMLSQSGVSHLVTRINDGTLPAGRAVCDETGANIHSGMASIEDSIGDLAKLSTIEKSNLVDAVNEVKRESVDVARVASEKASSAEANAASCTIASEKAAAHAKSIDDSLSAIAGSGDIPAATIAKVAENTEYIQELQKEAGIVVYKLEQGSIERSSGTKYDKADRVRSTMINSKCVVRVKSPYSIMQVFYYRTNEFTSASHTRTIDVLKAEANIEFKSGESFAAFVIRNEESQSSLITPTTDFGLTVTGDSSGKEALSEVMGGLEKALARTDSIETRTFGIVPIEVEQGSIEATYGYKYAIGTRVRSMMLDKECTISVKAPYQVMQVFYYKTAEFTTESHTRTVNALSANAEIEFFSGETFAAFVLRNGESPSSEITPDTDFGLTVILKGENLASRIAELERQNSTAVLDSAYSGKKMCTLGSSSTEGGQWQKYISTWLNMRFSQEENSRGVGYVKFADRASFWVGLDYKSELPVTVSSSPASMNIGVGSTSVLIDTWQDADGNYWRRAFRTSEGGKNLTDLNSELMRYAYDIKYYKPDVVFVMCYNEINAIPGRLGTINDAPYTKAAVDKYITIYSAYKGLVEMLLREMPGVEIVLVSAKLNQFDVYSSELTAVNVDMPTLRSTNRWIQDKAYHDALKEIAGFYGVKFVDMLEDTGYNPWTLPPFALAPKNVHCNEEGYKNYIAKCIHRSIS